MQVGVAHLKEVHHDFSFYFTILCSWLWLLLLRVLAVTFLFCFGFICFSYTLFISASVFCLCAAASFSCSSSDTDLFPLIVSFSLPPLSFCSQRWMIGCPGGNFPDGFFSFVHFIFSHFDCLSSPIYAGLRKFDLRLTLACLEPLSYSWPRNPFHR